MVTVETFLLVAFVTLLWTVALLYASSVVFWLYELLAAVRADTPDLVYGLDEVTVWVLTVDSEQVVQATVDSIPDGVAGIEVIAERPIEIEGTTVHVVPESFRCTATRKGRALEWARRELSGDSEFVLSLDEDSLIRNFEGLPDADVVQCSEQPIYTGSWLTYLSEMFRIGFQTEQRGFSSLRYPMYAWGGGLAIRRELMETVSWDEDSLIEDTAFLWRAVRYADADYEYLPTKFRNQAPPSVRDMLGQRRRWVSGSRQEVTALPRHYKLLYGMRNLTWGLTPLIPLLAVGSFVLSPILPFAEAFQFLTVAQVVFLFGCSVLGYAYYRERPLVGIVLFLLTPLVMVLHSAGATWGLFSPVTDFNVTRKIIPPEAIPDELQSILPGEETVEQ